MKRRKKTHPKLNLIPIMDAVFIFIFFLLMSAQFVDIYEIGTDAPITTSVEQQPDKKDPLNLKIIISKGKLNIHTGLDEKLRKSVSIEDTISFNKELIKIKQENPKESSAIIKPGKDIDYKEIVKVIDITKEITEKDIYVKVADADGKSKLSRRLFDQIIFETME